MRRLIFIVLVLTTVLTGFSPEASAQGFVSLRIDSTHCNDDSLRIAINYSAEREVVNVPPIRSASDSQTTIICGCELNDSSCSCTYRFPLSFSSFCPGSVMTSVQDIDFVRLNFEHSYSGVVLVALECPNGQFSMLVASSSYEYESMPCGDDKFDGFDRHGWFDYNYGEPIPDTFNYNYSVSPCDTSLYANRPGVGWNYCWSENVSHQYAPEGFIYRSHSGNGQESIDSTDIAADTHYYHPQYTFDSLIGCPLNGTWNIVVQQISPIHNGYVFEWELAFDKNMYQLNHLVSVEINGEGTIALDDTTYLLVPPERDTTINYTLREAFSCSDTLDTVFSIHWVEPFILSVTDTLCIGDTARWNNLFFTTDTLHLIRDTTVYGCDSIVDLSYTFKPSYSLHDTLPYCANETFLYEGVDYGGPTTVVIPHLTQYGCDSTVTVHLVTIDSLFHLQLQMSSDGEVWSADTVIHGCQPMTLHLRDTTLFERWRRWDFGDGDTLRQELTAYQQGSPFTHTYDSVGVYTLSLVAESIHGCVDSSVVRIDALHVYPTPTAEFSWSPKLIVSHDPWTQLVNQSTPLDSLRFEWAIPTGEGGTDTSSEESPHYRWPIGSDDIDVALSAIWPHVIGDTLLLECVDTTMHTIVITNDYLQFPNVVTPNGDGINDRWEIVNLLQDRGDGAEGGKPFVLYTMNELWIYNQWGALVYHVRDISREEDFWDPSPCPDGTYYFRFSAKSLFGLIRCNGTIEVVR